MEWIQCNDCPWEGPEDQLEDETQCPDCYSEDLEEVDLTKEINDRLTAIL
jgi:predicted Zn-ribbon and HTH transcriptional regulator